MLAGKPCPLNSSHPSTNPKSQIMEAIVGRLEAIALRLGAIVSRLGAILLRLEAIVSRLEAIALRLGAIVSRLKAIALRSEAIVSRLEAIVLRLEAIVRSPQIKGGNVQTCNLRSMPQCPIPNRILSTPNPLPNGVSCRSDNNDGLGPNKEDSPHKILLSTG